MYKIGTRKSIYKTDLAENFSTFKFNQFKKINKNSLSVKLKHKIIKYFHALPL